MFLLGLADLLSALLLVRGFYNVPIPNTVIFIFAGYLFIKALVFLFDVGSLIDIAAGILLILSITAPLPQFLSLIFAGLLGMKAVFSIMAGIR